MQRRQALALVGSAVIPFAGCLGNRGSSPTDSPVGTSGGTVETESSNGSPSPTPSERVETIEMGESYETADGRIVTVQDVSLRKLIRSTSVGSSNHIDVACLDGHQFAVVDVDALDTHGNSILEDVRFSLEIDDERFPRDDQHWYWAIPPGLHDWPGIPAFPAPITDASSAFVLWLRETAPPVRWRVPTDTVDRFSWAPAFAVQSVEVPETVSRGSVFDASVTVANTGDRDGRFVTEFGAGPISDHGEITVDVPAGTEKTHTEQLNPHYPESADEIDVTLNWGCDRTTQTVTVTD